MPSAPETDALGCDVGGTTVQLVHLQGAQVLRTCEIPSRPRGGGKRDGAGFIDRLVAAIDDLLEDAPGQRGSPPLGVALPGFLDTRRRGIVHLSHLPELDGLPLAEHLEKRLRTAVLLDTDSNAGAVGEARLGAGRGAERVLYVTLGTGLGAALTVEGEPLRTSHHTVGQIAHLPLEENGLRCGCGQRGCAEAVLSARGIVRRAGLGPRTSPRRLHEMAEAKDATALAHWRETGELLGRLLGILVPFLHPDVVVVGGGIAEASRYFLPAARSHLRRRLPKPLRRELRLETAALGRHAGAIGAAVLASSLPGTRYKQLG